MSAGCKMATLCKHIYHVNLIKPVLCLQVQGLQVKKVDASFHKCQFFYIFTLLLLYMQVIYSRTKLSHTGQASKTTKPATRKQNACFMFNFWHIVITADFLQKTEYLAAKCNGNTHFSHEKHYNCLFDAIIFK